MRRIRKLILFAGMALVAIAFSAAPAAAQEEAIEFIDEETGEPCSPCTVHAEGESHIRTIFGSVIARCHDEFEGFVNHDGTGELEWIGAQETTDHCLLPCSAAEERHWPISNPGETGTNAGHMTVRFCTNAGGGDSHCNFEGAINESGLHHYVLSTNQACSGGFSRFEGSWELETLNHDEVEIVHL